MPMDWPRMDRIRDLQSAGRNEEALSELASLENTSTNPEDNAVVWMAMANCLRFLRRPDEARGPIRSAYSVLGKTSYMYPRIMLIDALLEESHGNWKAELEKLDEILEKHAAVLQNPDNQDLSDEVLRHRGIALSGLGRNVEARGLLERALLDDYEKANTAYFLGTCYFQLGELDLAKQTLGEALSLGLGPRYESSSHYFLGVIHLRRAEFAWAKQEFEWCLEHLEHGGARKDYVITGLMKCIESSRNGKGNRALRQNVTATLKGGWLSLCSGAASLCGLDLCKGCGSSALLLWRVAHRSVLRVRFLTLLC
ncbi:MAG: tetratricopeptide repeat protein [Acidipila sp.]|nr:tetratricopeptide repeat protein [Acidipila sp.]